MASEARFSAKEAAMLANACLASTMADRKLSLLHLIDEKKISEAARKAAGSPVTLKAISKEIDDRIINARMAAKPSRKRYVGEAEVMYMASASLAKPLKLRKAARTKVYRLVMAWTKSDREGRDRPRRFELARHISYEPDVDFKNWLTLINEYSDTLDENVTMDPNIMGGVPIVKGTRVPVHTVSALLERGASVEKIKEDYPYLTDRAIGAAVLYARANPRTGRRKKSFR